VFGNEERDRIGILIINLKIYDTYIRQKQGKSLMV